MVNFDINWAAIGAKIIYWAGYIIFTGFFLFGLWLVVYIKGFKYKLTYWEVAGNVNDGEVSIDLPRKNRVKWNKTRTGWVLMSPLFKRKKEIEPFNADCVYPGKFIYAFKFGDSFVPAKIRLGDDVKHRVSIEPIPHHVKNWQMMELKENEREFAKHSFWEDNKYFFMVILTAGCCCLLVGLTVYYTYKFSSGGRADINSLTSALKSFGQSNMGGGPSG